MLEAYGGTWSDEQRFMRLTSHIGQHLPILTPAAIQLCHDNLSETNQIVRRKLYSLYSQRTVFPRFSKFACGSRNHDLFAAQGDHRVHTRGAARRDVAGKERDEK
jgi:hypothetical protein